jgi:hypothetical protein
MTFAGGPAGAAGAAAGALGAEALGGGAELAVTGPDAADVPELGPVFPVDVCLEKDLADPPQPTMELTAIAATLNFIKTLGPNCTATLEPIFPTN